MYREHETMRTNLVPAVALHKKSHSEQAALLGCGGRDEPAAEARVVLVNKIIALTSTTPALLLTLRPLLRLRAIPLALRVGPALRGGSRAGNCHDNWLN